MSGIHADLARRDGARGVVLAGNHQLLAARKLGWEEIAVVFVEDDDLTAKAFALADNRTAELGGYDTDLLAALLKPVSDSEALLAATGYTTADVERILSAAVPKAALTDPDAAPEPPATPVTQPGDLWLLGEHQLLCGDATEPTSYTRLLEGRRPDMVWTDPPYGVAYQKDMSSAEAAARNRRTDGLEVANDALTPGQLTEFLTAAFTACRAATRPGAVWFIASPAGPLFGVFGQVLTSLDVWRHTITWVKDQFVLGRTDYHYRHEPLFYGWTPGAAHREPPDRKQDTVWEIPRPKRSAEHPTMKPVALVQRAIENHTDASDLVIDPFGGSGTTLIAAESLRRRAALIELDARYADVICRRYQEYTGTKPVLDATGEPHDFTT